MFHQTKIDLTQKPQKYIHLELSMHIYLIL